MRSFDPVTNSQRAEWAQQCIDLFAAETDMRTPDGRNYEDNRTVLADLLADLRHWAETAGVDFDEVCEGSRGVYEDEVAEANELDNESPPTRN